MPETPKPETIFEIVETTRWGFVLLAFLAGGLIVLAAMALVDRKLEDSDNVG